MTHTNTHTHTQPPPPPARQHPSSTLLCRTHAAQRHNTIIRSKIKHQSNKRKIVLGHRIRAVQPLHAVLIVLPRQTLTLLQLNINYASTKFTLSLS